MIIESTRLSIIEFVKSQQISKENVTQFMTDCRTIIESSNQKVKYPILYFYCNWVLHPNIDRNPFLYDILGEINFKLSGVENFHVATVLKITKLIQEIAEFVTDMFQSERIMIMTSYLTRLTNQIFFNLTYRKIHFPIEQDKKEKKKIEVIINSTLENAEKVNTVDKFTDPQLDSEFDYSNPILIDSIMVKEVTREYILFQMTTTEQKPLMLQGIKIIITAKDNVVNIQYAEGFW
jgi:hypothetical protein